MMNILVATDAWHPQINGVVRTLSAVTEAARPFGASLRFITPDQFFQIPLPGYAEIRLGLAYAQRVEALIAQAQPDAIHVATEGPVGLAVRRYCIRRGLSFTTSFHTRFPDYLAARFAVPERWTWAWLRRFHAAAATTFAIRTVLYRQTLASSRGQARPTQPPLPTATIGTPDARSGQTRSRIVDGHGRRKAAAS